MSTQPAHPQTAPTLAENAFYPRFSPEKGPNPGSNAFSAGEDIRRITVSGVVIRDEAGRLLSVRKRGTGFFLFPGGKPEPGEMPEQCAIRECAEELHVRLDPRLLRKVGVFRTAAANEAGCELVAHVFEHPYVEVADPHAEIEELRWDDITVPIERLPDDLAQLTKDVIPVLLAQ